jgi:hypothetical protein
MNPRIVKSINGIWTVVFENGTDFHFDNHREASRYVMLWTKNHDLHGSAAMKHADPTPEPEPQPAAPPPPEPARPWGPGSTRRVSY